MIFHPTDLHQAWLIELEPRGDQRGFFARSMCQEEFARHGLVENFVQQNTSFSARRGTLRGLHYQQRPHGEAKLVRCIRGAIVDVIVDLRSDSPSYLQHQRFELDADNRHQLYVPPGFAHAFLTLCDEVEVSYRGHAGALWKRDHGAVIAARFPQLVKRASGFLDAAAGYDDCTFHVFERTDRW